MSLHALKPRFQALLRPAVGALHRLGVTANQVTVLACVISVALGALLVAYSERHALFLLLPFWFFLRMALNAIDGMLAREFGQASALGAYLNELCDVIADTALYLPFAFLPGSSVTLVAVTIFLATIAEMAGVLGVLVGAGRRFDGPMGKSDRALVFGTLALLVGFGALPSPRLSWALAAIIALLLVTIVLRVRRGLRVQ